MERRKSNVKKWTAFALALFMAVAALPFAVPAEAAGEITVEHVRDRDNQVKYLDGGTTSWYTANGNISYCLDPTKNGLSDTVTTGRIIDRSGNELMYKALYYLYGGPGYEESLFDPSLGTDDRYGLTHVVASYIVNGDAAWDAIGFGKDMALAIVEALRSRDMPPKDFQVFYYNEGHGTVQAFAGWRYNPEGYLSIEKESSAPDITDKNSCYTLKGAEYGVYDASGALKCTLVTDEDGKTDVSPELLKGEYTVRETKAPSGFKLDSSGKGVTVRGGETEKVKLTDEPVYAEGGVIGTKKDSETGTPQGAGTLKGAEFEVKFYGGYYESVSSLPAESLRTWTFRTDAEGAVKYDDAYKVSGDDLIKLNGRPVLPLGTLAIRETKAPEGYTLKGDTKLVKVAAKGDTASYEPAVFTDDIIRGSVYIEKWDAETKSVRPQGAGTLKGAKVSLYTQSDNPVRIGGKTYSKGSLIGEYETDENGSVTVSNLPYGRYLIKETEAPAGYLTEGNTERYFNIVGTGTAKPDPLKDMPKRGDLKGIKTEDGTGRRMGGIPFIIKSLTTGESHIILTDENGQFSTESSWNSHMSNTNRGETPDDGVWFGDMSAVSDSRGALPYDSYEVEELRCDANMDKKLLSFTVQIRKNGVTVDLGTLTNDSTEMPEIDSMALGEGGEKDIYVSDAAVILDEVRFRGLTPGEKYTLVTSLADTETGELIEGAGTETVFSPRSGEGKVTPEVTLNALGLEGKSVTVFERLIEDDLTVAVHEDTNDEDQTVKFVKPSIGTEARSEEGGHEACVGLDVTLTDTVTYSGLDPGSEYTLKGVLMDKATGEPVKEGDKDITSEVNFTPERSDGKTEVKFTFNAVPLMGRETVVFERLYLGGHELCAHADIKDKGQTVLFKTPFLGTSASSGGEKKVRASEKTVIEDQVRYKDLKSGVTYTLLGTLMDKDTGKPVKVNGKEVTAEKTFTASGSGGTETVEFSFNSVPLMGKKTVVFERLFEKDVLIAFHEDIDDEGQTVEFLKEETDMPIIVKTGDDTDMLPFTIAASAAAAAVALAFILRKKEEKDA